MAVRSPFGLWTLLLCVACVSTGKAVRVDEDEEAATAITTNGQETTTTTSAVASSGKAYRKLTCKFDAKSIEAKPGTYQEPSRLFSEADWKAIGYKTPEAQDQDARLRSMTATYKVVSAFFAKILPNVRWWLSSGSLIGAIRSGTIIPWDTDGDLGVDMDAYNTEATWKILNNQSGVKKLNSEECQNGGCIFVPVPKSVDPSQSFGFAVHQIPTNREWIGRFVDLNTGYFVEIINDGPQASKVQKCSLNGVEVNIPTEPVQLLKEQKYDGLRTEGSGAVEFLGLDKKGSECSMEKCSTATGGDGKKLKAATDPFTTTLVQEASEGDASDEWQSLDPNMQLDDCKQVELKKDQKVFVKANCFS